MESVTIERIVREENLAVNMKSGSLEVLATPQMIAWMEEASCLVVEMEEGNTSVGTCMNVSHDKASPLGATITITATLTAREGRKLCFDVIAYEGENVIGKGKHERFIVNSEKFLKRTYGK